MSNAHNVFISWSGKRSRYIAEALRSWLPLILQTAKPWLSVTDIDKGSRGLDEVVRALEDIKIGIVCLTPENQNEPWILYEAGALSKTIDDKSRLCTYLLGDLQFQDVKPPLGLFQAAKADKEETRKLVHSVNKAINHEPVITHSLDLLFDRIWPILEESLNSMPQPNEVVDAKRSLDEMIAEILDLTRSAATSRKKTEELDPLIPKLAPLLGSIDVEQYMRLLQQVMPSMSAFASLPKDAIPAVLANLQPMALPASGVMSKGHKREIPIPKHTAKKTVKK